MTIRLWLLSLISIFSGPLSFPMAFAEEGKQEKKEGRFETGLSPDGRTEITLLARPSHLLDDSIGRIELEMMDAKSRRVLDSFPFDDFASFASNSYKNRVFSSDDVRCAWRSDSRWVALSYVMTRGFVGTTVYTRRRGHWVKVAMPEFFSRILKISRAAGEKRVSVNEGINDKGHESEVVWLPGHRMRLEASYRGITRPDDDTRKLFWVTFRVVGAAGKSKPKIILEKVAFVSDPVPEKH